MKRAAPCLLLFAAALGGCAKVLVHPEGDLPKPVIVATPAKVGVVVTPETAHYTHKESRASVDYEADLGPSHKHLVEEIFGAEFTEAKIFESVDAARAEPGILAIFEPRIDQFSFASAKETGGVYCAVTIRYQIAVFAPDGSLVDNLTLTGYGSGPAPKIGNGEEELGIAAYAAMRDAAAKFLTQFPDLELAKPLLASQALKAKVQPVPGSSEALAANTETIEQVPINDPPVAQITSPASSPMSAPAVPAPDSATPADPATPPASAPPAASPPASPPPSQMSAPLASRTAATSP
jgi:hypothetical protein